MNARVKGFPNEELKTFAGAAIQIGRTPKSHSEPLWKECQDIRLSKIQCTLCVTHVI